MGRRLCWVLAIALAAGTLSAGPSKAAATAGPFDFNGDGYADLATGVPGESLGSVEGAGAVQVIYGSAEGLTSKDSRLLSLASSGVVGDPESYDEFGRALASADVDRDGFADLIVLTTRRIVVLFGTLSGLPGRSQILTPRIRGSVNTYLEAVVLGDFDGDRLSDIAVSTLDHDVGESTEGPRVMVFRGSPNGFSSTPALEFGRKPPGFDAAEHSLGRGLAAGDVSGDGFDDLVVGTGDVVDEWAGLAAVGGLHFIPGSRSGLRLGDRRFIGRRTPGVRQRGAVVTDELGSALAVADFDRDGFADVAVGDPAGSDDKSSCDPDAPCGGAVLILRGSRDGPITRELQRWAPTKVMPADPVASDRIEDNPSNRFGTRLAVGDLDRDGHHDLAVAAPLDQVAHGRTGTGRVYMLYGSRAGLSSVGQRVSQRTPGVRGIGRVGERFGSGGLQILDCGHGSTADLLVHSGDDRSTRGTVTVLYGSRRGETVREAQLWHQDMPGVPGRGERDDRLGEG